VTTSLPDVPATTHELTGTAPHQGHQHHRDRRRGHDLTLPAGRSARWRPAVHRSGWKADQARCPW